MPFQIPTIPFTLGAVISCVMILSDIIMCDGALYREKDVLWQKTDALEFEQKLREEETERDVNYCLGCHSQFSWWLRKYNCRSASTIVAGPMSHTKNNRATAHFELVDCLF